MKMLPATSVVLASLAFLGACGSPPRYIEPGGTESVVSVGEVDIQDIKNAASKMLDSLLETGVLGRAKNQPAQLVIGEIKNDTSSQFDLGELTYRMREHLVNSGKAQVLTTWGSNPEDKIAQEELKSRSFRENNPSLGAGKPDYSLTGKITRIKRQVDRTHQMTYTFRLTLTDLSKSVEVWTKIVDMTKLGTKPGIGF